MYYYPVLFTAPCMGLSRAERAEISRVLREAETEGEEVKNGMDGSISSAQLPKLLEFSRSTIFRLGSAEFNIMANIIGDPYNANNLNLPGRVETRKRERERDRRG